MENKTEYRDYTLLWTGWKQAVATIKLHAQWVARKPSMEDILYCTVPFGDCKYGKADHILDIATTDQWSVVPVDIFSEEETKEMWQKQGLTALKDFVDRFIDELKEEAPAAWTAPTFTFGSYITCSAPAAAPTYYQPNQQNWTGGNTISVATGLYTASCNQQQVKGK